MLPETHEITPTEISAASHCATRPKTDSFVSEFQVLLYIWYNCPVSNRPPDVYACTAHAWRVRVRQKLNDTFQYSMWHITFTWRVDRIGYCLIQVYLLAHWFSATRHRPISWVAILSLTIIGKFWYLHCQVSSVTVSVCRNLHPHNNSTASSHIRCGHPRRANLIRYYPLESFRVVMWSCYEDHHSTDNLPWWHMQGTSYINKRWDKWTLIGKFKGGIVFVYAACPADLLSSSVACPRNVNSSRNMTCGTMTCEMNNLEIKWRFFFFFFLSPDVIICGWLGSMH